MDFTTLGDDTLMDSRSRISKLQETLHYFLAQPNLSWPDALEKFNVLATQSFNLSEQLDMHRLKGLSLFPIKTLPDPNLIPNVYLRKRLTSEEVEVDQSQLCASQQQSIFGESHVMAAMSDDEVERQLNVLSSLLNQHDESCYAAWETWQSITQDLFPIICQQHQDGNTRRQQKSHSAVTMEGNLEKTIKWWFLGQEQ